MTNFNHAISKLVVNRPPIITNELSVLEYSKDINPFEAAKALLNSQYVLISDLYSSGMVVLEALQSILKKQNSADTFKQQRKYRDTFKHASSFLLIEVVEHSLYVRKAPEIGWIKILYPELPDFFLPFTDVQGLNSAWQWYKKGIRIPGLKQTLHPFYGTYFPTRFEHIELFVDYLKHYSGKKDRAFDIGIGSGVLSKLFHQFDFKEINASDINPNALIGNLYEKEHIVIPKEKINLYFGDLFAGSEIKSDVIAFNPPWIPLPKEVSGIDQAIYYDKDLFPRFFEEAYKHLNPEGQLVILFSNLAGLMDPKFTHPVEAELKTGKRFELVVKTTKKVAGASPKTKRKALWRDEELGECWVLKKKTHLTK